MKLNKSKNREILIISVLGFLLLFSMLSANGIVKIFPRTENSDVFIDPISSDANGGGYIMNTEASYSWIDISSTGTPLSLSSMEQISFSEAGWNFIFYENEHDSIYVSPFGYMNFHSLGGYTNFVQIPSLSDINEDLVSLLSGISPYSGEILYQFLSGPNMLVIEYLDITSGSYDLYGNFIEEYVGTFEVILYETGNIKFQYQIANLTSGSGYFYPAIGLDHGDLENYNSYEPDDVLYLKAIDFTPGVMVPINFSPGVEVDDELMWLVTNVDDEKMESYLGSNWEELLGLYPDPLEYQKTKIKIYIAYGDSAIMSINYSTWDWIDKEESFSSTPEGSYGFSYSNDPEGQTLDPLFPFILPTPTALYLYRARLDGPYYFSYDGYSNRIILSYSVASSNMEISIQFQAEYNSHGILENLQFSILNWSSTLIQPELIFNLIRYQDGPIPSYISINEGDVYEYGMYFNSSIPSDPYNPTVVYDRMKIGVELVSGEDPIYERVLVIFKVSYRYPNGTWVDYPYSPQSMYTYIYKDYSNLDSYGFQPIFVSNDIDWNEFVAALEASNPSNYPVGYEMDYYVLEDGFGMEQTPYMPYGGKIRVDYTYTPEGVVNIVDQYINDSYAVTFRLNDFDFVFNGIGENFPLGVEIGNEYEWVISDINVPLMDDYFGEYWEVFFGLPENPSELDKMKIRIDSIEVDSTQKAATYDLWNWIELESAFNPTADSQDSLTYLDDPLGYTEVHNLTNMIPFFIPTPSQSYLTQGNLDPMFYNPIYSSIYDPETTQISFYKGIEMFDTLSGTAIYDKNGVLISFQISMTSIDPYTYTYETVMIFSMLRNTEGIKPFYVGINEGETYEYGVFVNPAVNYPSSIPFSDIERMMFEIDYIGGEDLWIQGALVLLNMSTMDENGIWSDASETLMSPFGTSGYIAENPAEQFYLFLTFSYFVRTGADWDEIANAVQEYYDRIFNQYPGYEYDTIVSALSNGLSVYIEQPDGSILESFTTYTETGAINIATSKINGTEYLSIRLNDFDYEFPVEDTEPPTITVEYIGGHTDGDPGYISVTATDNVGLSEDPTGEYPVDPTIIDTPRVFSYTATDKSGLTTTETIEITLTDDDIEAPEITYEYTGDGTDGNPGEVIITATDDSGLSIDPSGSIEVPNEPGTYWFNLKATDADNDRVGDSLSSSIVFSIEIVDDDTQAPILTEISYDATIYDNQPTFTVEIKATDASGINKIIIDFIEEYEPVLIDDMYYFEIKSPQEPGIYGFQVILQDADMDRVGDNLNESFYLYFIRIVDDDTEAPTINILYTGDYNLENPGELIVTASDKSGLSVDPSGTYSVPAVAGTHEWEFIATDDDDDGWTGDSLTTTVKYSITIRNLIPVANFTVDSSYIQKNEEITFTFTGTEGDAPASFLWDFGDGETSTEKNPTHIYSSVGLYTVSLTVTDVNGDVDVITKEHYIWVMYAFPATPGLFIMMILGFIGVSIVLGIIIKKKK